MEQLNKLLIEMERVNERVQGSSWRIKKYHYISADMDKTKPSRASSYIALPNKYQNAKCGLINIKNTEDYCTLYHQSKKKEIMITDYQF